SPTRRYSDLQGELAEEQSLLQPVRRAHTASRQQPDGDREVQGRAALAQVGGRQIEHHVPRRKLEAAVRQRGPHSHPALAHRRLRQAHDLEAGDALREVDLDVHRPRVDPDHAPCSRPRQHVGPLPHGPCRISARVISRTYAPKTAEVAERGCRPPPEPTSLAPPKTKLPACDACRASPAAEACGPAVAAAASAATVDLERRMRVTYGARCEPDGRAGTRELPEEEPWTGGRMARGSCCLGSSQPSQETGTSAGGGSGIAD